MRAISPTLNYARLARKALFFAAFRKDLDFLPSLVQTMYSLDSMADGQPQLLPGTLYMLILRALSGGPLHGYAIARRIKQCSADVLDVEEGSLYPALNRMLIKGWLRADWGVSETNRKARFYRLTKEGRSKLVSEENEFNKLIKAIQLVMKTA